MRMIYGLSFSDKNLPLTSSLLSFLFFLCSPSCIHKIRVDPILLVSNFTEASTLLALGRTVRCSTVVPIIGFPCSCSETRKKYSEWGKTKICKVTFVECELKSKGYLDSKTENGGAMYKSQLY